MGTSNQGIIEAALGPTPNLSLSHIENVHKKIVENQIQPQAPEPFTSFELVNSP
jgi:hypothetical protein